MGRKASVGLFKIGEIWHIDKHIYGERVCRTTKCSDLAMAEQFLAKLMEECRQASVYGVRPKRTFSEAFEEYLVEKAHKRSLDDDKSLMNQLRPWIGDTPIDEMHMGKLRPWITKRQQDGVKTNTINMGLKLVRQVLNCAVDWYDDNNLTWLATVPKIKLLPVNDQSKPYPLDWDEQDALMAVLPLHLRDMSLFKVNTGIRDQEVCNLRWEWEQPIKLLNTSIFIIPKEYTKSKRDRLVVLNSTAEEVVERCRGQHDTHVFTFRGRPVKRMMNSGWKSARKKIGLSKLRVHDLKHTFGRRLRAANVSFEDRQDLLGHKAKEITTHYSAANIQNLIEASERVSAGKGEEKPALVILR